MHSAVTAASRVDSVAAAAAAAAVDEGRGISLERILNGNGEGLELHERFDGAVPPRAGLEVRMQGAMSERESCVCVIWNTQIGGP